MSTSDEQQVARFRVRADDGTEFIIHTYQSSSNQNLIYRTAGSKDVHLVDEPQGIFRIRQGPMVRRV